MSIENTFRPALVDELTGEHKELVRIFVAAMEAAKQRDAARTATLLAEFQAALHTHLSKENINLYAWLNLTLKGEEAMQMADFRSEMQQIAKVVTSFLDKYRAVDVNGLGVFLSEADGVAKALLDRISREESLLYPLYRAAGKAEADKSLLKAKKKEGKRTPKERIKDFVGSFKTNVIASAISDLVGKDSSRRNQRIVAGIMLVGAVITGAGVYISREYISNNAVRRASVDDMSYLAERMDKDVPTAMSANHASFVSLWSALIQFNDELAVFEKGTGSVPPVGASVQAEYITPLRASVKEISESHGIINDGGSHLINTALRLGELEARGMKVSKHLTHMTSYLMQHASGPAALSQANAVSSMEIAVKRITSNLNVLSSALNPRPQALSEIMTDLATLYDTLAAMRGKLSTVSVMPLKDAEFKEMVDASAELIIPLYEDIDGMIPALGKLMETKEAAGVFVSKMSRVNREVSVLRSHISHEETVGEMLYVGTMLLGGVTFALALLLSTMIIRANRAEAMRVRKVNDENQIAIDRLVSEIAFIADGDLTQRATAGDGDITASLAETFNYTTQRLSGLINEVKDASELVILSSEESMKATKVSREISVKQREEIGEAAKSVLDISAAVKTMADDAQQAAGVANQALSASESGLHSVREMGGAMGEVRTQVQDTAKRLKRMGEASQEISVIVDAIADISEQTNVLALNANVQAAAAGEAGRSFAAVAAEVQRLAARTEEWLKRITAIVDTVQSESKEAISSMEQTTQRVVLGTTLSEQAGAELEQIANVSRQLANIVHRIDASAQAKAADATTVADRITQTQALTQEAADRMAGTAKDMEKIRDMTSELAASVEGFKV